jgi:DNA polymerase I-like protein with 3'-5' exonuclease and polymerase domains
MNILTLDFETYYDTHFSLKKMAPLLYIRSPEFKVHGAAFKFNDRPATWVSHNDLDGAFADIDWDNTRVVTHNANFDLVILHEHYGVSPGDRVDTLGLCRALLPGDLDFNLGAIAPLLGLGEKGKELVLSKGHRDLPLEIEEALAGYACQDAELTYGIYTLLYPHLQSDEAEIHNLILRLSTEGMLEFDRELAAEALIEETELRDAKIKASGATATQLRSNPQFAKLLEAAGVEVPMKTSMRTGKETFAFSKQDPAFIKLWDNPDIAHLMNGREAASSNNSISRIETLIKITERNVKLPMQLNYHGAHTGRLSGGGKINMQNLNRGSKLRRAIRAPEGYMIVVADSAQIELRLNMWFSGQLDVVELLRNGGDVYKREAANQFDISEDEVTKEMRQFGKILQLACGFSMGADKFRSTCAIGPMGNPPIHLSAAEARDAVYKYRDKHRRVKDSWDWLQGSAIPLMQSKRTNVKRGPITVQHERILLPNGIALQYPNLEAEEDGWIFGMNGMTHRIYGGRLQENIVQALAGVLIKQQMLEISRRIPWAPVVHQVHDEIIALAPEDRAEEAYNVMFEIMSTPPDWAPDLPLSADGGWAREYSK